MPSKYLLTCSILVVAVCFYVIPHIAKAWPVSIKTLVITDSAAYAPVVDGSSGSAAPVSFMSNSNSVLGGRYCSKAKCNATPGCSSSNPGTYAAAFVHGTSGVTDNNFFDLIFDPQYPGWLCFGGSKYCGLVTLDYGATSDGYGFNCACKLSTDPAGYSTFQESIDLTNTGYALDYVEWYSNAITDCAGWPVNHYSYQDTSVCTSTYPKIAITQTGDKYSWDTSGANGYYTWIFVAIKPKPTCNLLVKNNGGTIDLNWTTQNTTSASIDNGVGSVTSLGSGSKTGITTPAVATTYTMTVHNQLPFSWSKDVSNTCTATFTPPPAFPLTCDLIVSPPNINVGMPVSVSWNFVRGATPAISEVQNIKLRQTVGINNFDTILDGLTSPILAFPTDISDYSLSAEEKANPANIISCPVIPVRIKVQPNTSDRAGLGA